MVLNYIFNFQVCDVQLWTRKRINVLDFCPQKEN